MIGDDTVSGTAVQQDNSDTYRLGGYAITEDSASGGIQLDVGGNTITPLPANDNAAPTHLILCAA